MKKKFLMGISLSVAALMACFAFAACGDNPGEVVEQDPPQEEDSFNYDTRTWEFTDLNGNKATLDYGLYVPDSYSATGTALPLITYVPDSGYVDKDVDYLASGGECLSHWITEDKMKDNPAIFLFLTFSSANASKEGQEIVGLSDARVDGTEAAQVVPIIDSLCDEFNIDTNRLYLTGQSMGGILDWSINTKYPDKFAATVYVGCQPGDEVSTEEAPNQMYDEIIEQAEFLDQKFVYISSRLDMKAPFGQDDVEAKLNENGLVEGVDYGKNYELAFEDLNASNETLKTLFASGYDKYFVAFPQVANGNGGFEHLRSFDPAYSLDAIFEWLVAQSL